MEPLLLSPREVAEALAIGRSTAYALMAAGVLPSVRIGSSVRAPAATLKAWVAEQRQQANSAQV